MHEFRDYSTYLQRIVKLEKQVHNQCNDKNFALAKSTVNNIIAEALALANWIEENYNVERDVDREGGWQYRTGNNLPVDRVDLIASNLKAR